MRKITMVSLGILASSLLISGCSTLSLSNNSSEHEHFGKEIELSKLNKIIIDAGRKDGWRMTEFKDNEVIAEKDGEAYSVKYSSNYFYIEPENDDLEDAIEDAIEDRLED